MKYLLSLSEASLKCRIKISSLLYLVVAQSCRKLARFSSSCDCVVLTCRTVTSFKLSLSMFYFLCYVCDIVAKSGENNKEDSNELHFWKECQEEYVL